MTKNLYFISLILLPLITFAGPMRDIPKHYSSDGDMGFEADGLDMWDLNGVAPAIALEAFKTKCSTEIPRRITDRFPQNGLDAADFNFITRIDQYYIRGYGTSYRCYIHAVIKDPTQYSFTPWQATDEFYDIRDDQGNITTTAVDQCKQSIAKMESTVSTMKLFDRHALLSWTKDSTGNPVVGMCYVTYINLLQKR